MTSSTPPPTVSWVLLTMGDRPNELATAVESIGARPGLDEVIVVVNGAAEAVVPAGVRAIHLPENLGIPRGRNEGAAVALGEVVCFLDDDASIVTPDVSATLEERFATQADLGVVGFRITDPDTGETARRHVPRLGGDPTRSGEVTHFLGGASAVRASAFRDVGGLPADFFYALEETDLAWRLIDAGWRVTYDADIVLHHPRTEIDRHGFAARLTARNRVLLARRLLPWVLAPIYVGVWAAITAVRSRSLRSWWAGTREGLRMSVERRPIGWRTVLRLTRLGRPPVI